MFRKIVLAALIFAAVPLQANTLKHTPAYRARTQGHFTATDSGIVQIDVWDSNLGWAYPWGSSFQVDPASPFQGMSRVDFCPPDGPCYDNGIPEAYVKYTFFALPGSPSSSWPTGVELPLYTSDGCAAYWNPRYITAWACLQTDCGGYDIPVDVDNGCGATIAVRPTTWAEVKVLFK